MTALEDALAQVAALQRIPAAKDMTATELRYALTLLRLPQETFARILGTSPNTVSRWCTGGLPVPSWAGSWLFLYAAYKKSAGVTP